MSAAIPPSDSKNYFTGDGGSLLVHGTAGDTWIEIRDSIFKDSIAYGNGGAISLSKDSSPDGRQYFVTQLGVPPVAPEELGGGCRGLISNVVFVTSRGGWQGGAISANGRGMDIDIMNSIFDDCQGGATHRRDGKGGAVAVCGGLQSAEEPMNDILVTRCQINSCSASGNGGGLYVTIRGKLRVDDTILDNCTALNSGQGFPLPTDDYRMVEGMGGGIYVSAGGYVYLQSEGSTSVRILNGNAAVSGGGLSVKSAKAFVQGTLTVQGNMASGTALDGYGNGGGIFVTTSYYDDFIGAGFGAALLYNEHGYLSSTVSGSTITGNTANRWGGGIYAGISPPWYDSVPPKNLNGARVTLKNATVQNNIALRAASVSPLMPAQITGERVGDGAAVLDFGGTTISGNATTDIGIYTLDSIAPATAGTVFGTLAAQTIAEPP